MVIDLSGITVWMKSKTTISTIAAVIVFLAGARGYVDYPTAVEIATALMGLAAIFMRNAIAKVETQIKDIPGPPPELPAA